MGVMTGTIYSSDLTRSGNRISLGPIPQHHITNTISSISLIFTYYPYICGLQHISIRDWCHLISGAAIYFFIFFAEQASGITVDTGCG